MKKLIFILTMAGLISSCSDPKMEKIDSLKEECISIHDEVMPRMGEMVELSSGIKEIRIKLDSDTTDSAHLVRIALVKKVEQLDSAHEAMMVWMNDYIPDYEAEHSSDESIAFYEEQKKSITEVKDIMLKSIEDGKETLDRAK
ncbi:hypothetical protein N8Z47_05675 [Salibacteraceae bacterium]|nr:hypothetical protein [Salibacteraceae bacterium]